MKQAKSIIAARIIAVLDEAELAVRKAQGMPGFVAVDFSRIRNASLAPFTLDRLTHFRAALDGESGLQSTPIRGGPGRQRRSSRADGRCVSGR